MVDDNEEEVEKQDETFEQLSSPGLDKSFGTIREDTLSELQGTKKVKKLKEMSRFDHTTSSALTLIRLMIRNIDWEVEGGDEAGREFLKSNMQDMDFSWDQTIANASLFLDFGWMLQEIVYKKREGDTDNKRTNSKFDDGMIGWRKFSPIGHETVDEWIFDEEDDQIIGVEQDEFSFKSSNTAQQLPISKLLHYRTQIGLNNPEGRSVLESAFRAWQIKKHYENVESVGIERDMSGYPVMEVPIEIIKAKDDETSSIRDVLLETIANVRRDENEGMLFPRSFDENGNKRFDFKLMQDSGNRGFDMNETITRYDVRILQTLLAEFIMLGVSKRGSFSLAQSKINLFLTGLNGYADIIKNEINGEAIPRLWKLNGMDPSNAPRVEATDIRNPQIRQIAQLLSSMSQSGAEMFPNEDLKSQLLSRMGFTESLDEQVGK